ncbi:Rab GTPase [Heterostelium album PN500]|uniref:Ras-related protein Rab-7b n=1 Tax=Heterostelium pallidum (strain ATCC 26659 / Pp 5 / PN500) TaxID=670386 RepID=D3BAT6_HETP5|nr:Rab GTPase [Heterostelium album PN500]EFA81673.1 Rab GTPase [Heterostelium album PN500]|eukprot:XP_020433790.1 Rab GTPase [Heterostelium album PN500]
MAPRKVVKIVIIGEKSVGKTSILKRYVDQRFVPLKPTIGVDFVNKDVMVNDKMVTLQLWDTSGQERFRSLEISYYRGADCCILVFDVTNEKTLHELKMWREDFIDKTGVQNPDQFPFVVLGNKVDEPENRKVTERAATNFIKEIGGNIFYFDTSAKDATNIEEAFATVSRISLQNLIPSDSQRK